MGSQALVQLRPLLLMLAGGVSLALATCVVKRASDDASPKPEPAPVATASPTPAAAVSANPGLAPATSITHVLPAAPSAPVGSAQPALSEPFPMLPSSKSGLPIPMRQLLPEPSSPPANAPQAQDRAP